MKLLLLVAFLVSNTLITAQDFDRFQTILPQAPIPKDFTDRSSDKVATEVTGISEKKNRVEKTKKNFVLESTFGIDDFLASGSVLFNDEVSLYLNSVLQELLKPQPDLQKKIRVYAVKSTSVNAFTTNNGIIFVNFGLLSRLENEAQLAFVLAHEVIHYRKQHVINSYITNIEIDESKGDYRKLKVDEKGFAKSTYSRELESEADLEGADLYAASTYAKDSVDKVFDVFKLADAPLMLGTFSKRIFESGSYVFPSSHMPDHVKPVDVDEDYDDTHSTHPNIKKRKQAISGKFKRGGNGNYFNISKTRFYKVRKIARFELCRLYLLEHRYTECIGLATGLQKEEPESTYLRESVAKAFYGLAVKSLVSDLKVSDDDWAGEAERLATFIARQSSYELGVLALRQLYMAKEANPENSEVSLMVNHLMQVLADKHESILKGYLRSPAQKVIPDLTEPYTQYAFLDFSDINAFATLFAKQAEIAKKKPVTKSGRKKLKERSLNVNKLVVVKPLYKKVDTRKKQKIRHIDSEEVLININDKINDAASELSMKVDIINPNKVSGMQVTLMQNNSILNDWIDEQMRSGDAKTVSPIYNEVLGLADAYKTDHFAWIGALAMRHKTPGKAYAVLGAVLLPAVAPWAAAYVVSPKGKTLYFAIVFNVRTQELELLDVRPIAMKDSESLLQSNIYYTLSMLKK
jgi:beta-barrel assembly-enhancing protease